jgi:hypothetical protein
MKPDSISGFVHITTLFLVIAKAFKLIEISWLEVFYPMLILYTVSLIAILVVMIIAGIYAVKEMKKNDGKDN